MHGQRDRGVTSPYLNVRPHHGVVGVVGGQLGAQGALGGQNQVGWEGLSHPKVYCFLRPC